MCFGKSKNDYFGDRELIHFVDWGSKIDQELMDIIDQVIETFH